MGMDAQLVAFGPYSPAVKNYLEYANNYYAETKPGTLVFACCVFCVTTAQSKDLARALGVGPWDFNQHHFPVLSQQQIQAVAALTADWYDDEGPLVIERLTALSDGGFQFFYLPQG